jgi:5-methylcytosine-specific restriction endonuclease McrA
MLCNQRFISKIRRERDCYEKYCSHLCANRAKDFKGAKNPNWKDDATSRNGRGRLSSAYVKWKRSVLDRDNHTCVYCGSKDRVQADHQEPWALFPESRFEVNNGQALCLSCHTRKTIHQRMHKAKKRDINEIEIVMAIREEGWDVYRLDEPCDLLCWHPVLSILQWLEVKTIHEGRKKPAVDKRQESQRKFLARTSCPIVTTPDEAFEVLCRHYPSDVARPDLVLMAKRIRDEFERSWKARAAA